MVENCLCGKFSVAFCCFSTARASSERLHFVCQVEEVDRQSMAAACSLFYKEEGMFIVAWLYCSSNMKEKKREALLQS